MTPNEAAPIDLLSVRCFIAAAEELHFGRAAERLCMSQPTLSQHVRRLEESITVRLLERSTRRVELTPAGRVFLLHANDFLQTLDEAITNTQIEAGILNQGGGKLVVGAISPAMDRLLPKILSRFHKRFPKTRLEIRESSSNDILRDIENGTLDVGILRPPTRRNAIRTRRLISERFVAVLPRKSVLAQKSNLRMSDFSGHTVFALRRFELEGFESLCQILTDAGLLSSEGFEVSDTNAAIAMVASGIGITFLPEWVSSSTNPGVVVRAVEDLTAEIGMEVCWKSGNPAPGLLPFLEHASRVADVLKPASEPSDTRTLSTSS